MIAQQSKAGGLALVGTFGLAARCWYPAEALQISAQLCDQPFALGCWLARDWYAHLGLSQSELISGFFVSVPS